MTYALIFWHTSYRFLAGLQSWGQASLPLLSLAINLLKIARERERAVEQQQHEGIIKQQQRQQQQQQQQQQTQRNKKTRR
jgi:hypothetical protein